ncbi:MAG: hypothetical protein WBJ81_00905 [Rickettsiales bacterium]
MSKSSTPDYKNKNSTKNTNAENLTPDQARHIIYSYVPELDLNQALAGETLRPHLEDSSS